MKKIIFMLVMLSSIVFAEILTSEENRKRKAEPIGVGNYNLNYINRLDSIERGIFKGKVLKVINGDTMRVSYDIERPQPINGEKSWNRVLNIRLLCADAPEPKQTYGVEAKAFLTKLVEGKDIILGLDRKDRYGRRLGGVYVNINDVDSDIRRNINEDDLETFDDFDGKYLSVAKYMIRNGYAWNNLYNHRDYLALQDEAIQNKRGLWGVDKMPIHPATYKEINHLF